MCFTQFQNKNESSKVVVLWALAVAYSKKNSTGIYSVIQCFNSPSQQLKEWKNDHIKWIIKYILSYLYRCYFPENAIDFASVFLNDILVDIH